MIQTSSGSIPFNSPLLQRAQGVGLSNNVTVRSGVNGNLIVQSNPPPWQQNHHASYGS